MAGWDTSDVEEIVVGRRMRVGRRRPVRGPALRVVTAVVIVVLVGLGVGGYLWFNRPTGLAMIPDPAVVAPGGYRASIGAKNTITVGLEIRNVAEVPLTVTSAKIVAPRGLTVASVTLLTPGEGNQGFTLEGDLPALAPITLGTSAGDRNAILAARFTVDCSAISDAADVDGEQIFVTIEVDGQARVEELTPPVLDDLPWLAGSARRVCVEPLPAESPEPPLPPLPAPSGAPASPAAG
ncbi:MAG TPA: hypothetical protein VF163_19255 [Micromonosporaceae bacterium]